MSDRFQNVSGHEHCPHCIDGLALVGFRAAAGVIVVPHGRVMRKDPVEDARYEEYAPCPWCEKGFKAEWPNETRQRVWKGGYWQGRPPVVEDPPAAEPKPLPARENQLRLKLLLNRYERIAAGQNEGLPDPCIGLDKEMPAAERFTLLHEYARVVGVL